MTNKVRYKQEYDFPKDLLFDKFIEVLQNSDLKIIQTDKNTGDILAISSISWQSWGENIYISLEEKYGKTIVDFCSACIFQIYAWGKNQRNYEKFIKEFEESLII
ncbi:MAG: hypothetical protein V1779_04020 [bacterium]